MDMKLFDGDICTPQGFIIDTFECYLNNLTSYANVIVADNPCTVAFKYSESLKNAVSKNVTSLKSTKGIAQAIIIEITQYDIDFVKNIYNLLGLYDENFLLNFALDIDSTNPKDYTKGFAIQFNICGVDCTLGVLKYGSNVYVTTDVAITHDMIDLALNDIYYQVNINGTLCVIASGIAGNRAITKCNYNFNTFKKALDLAVTNL
jgi:hypothetical protein